MRASVLVMLSVLLATGSAIAARGSPSQESLQHPRLAQQRLANAGDPVASLYGHVATMSDGRGHVDRFWLAADHTFRWQGQMGERGHGLWSLRGDEICLSPLTEADPAGRARELARPAAARCAEFRAGHRAGDSWTQHNDRGELVSVRLD